MRRGVGLLAVCLILGASTASAAGPKLSDVEARRWFEQILPEKKEIAYSEIPWRPTMMEAVIEAQRVDKPILLWMMRGHPLGLV